MFNMPLLTEFKFTKETVDYKYFAPTEIFIVFFPVLAISSYKDLDIFRYGFFANFAVVITCLQVFSKFNKFFC